jgi:hypothetical protein
MIAKKAQDEELQKKVLTHASLYLDVRELNSIALCRVWADGGRDGERRQAGSCVGTGASPRLWSRRQRSCSRGLPHARRSATAPTTAVPAAAPSAVPRGRERRLVILRRSGPGRSLPTRWWRWWCASAATTGPCCRSVRPTAAAPPLLRLTPSRLPCPFGFAGEEQPSLRLIASRERLVSSHLHTVLVGVAVSGIQTCDFSGHTRVANGETWRSRPHRTTRS